MKSHIKIGKKAQNKVSKIIKNLEIYKGKWVDHEVFRRLQEGWGGDEDDSRLWQLKSGCSLALKNTVDEDPVLAIAGHKEIRMIVVNFEVSPGDEIRMAHIDVNLALAAVTSNSDAPLAHHVLEFATLEPGDGCSLGLWVPLHLGGTRRRGLKRQECPRVAFLRTRVSGHRRRCVQERVKREPFSCILCTRENMHALRRELVVIWPAELKRQHTAPRQRIHRATATTAKTSVYARPTPYRTPPLQETRTNIICPPCLPTI